MSGYRRNGLIAGAFAGFVAAATNWDGRIIVAASSILTGAMIGWAVGYFLEKRNSAKP